MQINDDDFTVTVCQQFLSCRQRFSSAAYDVFFLEFLKYLSSVFENRYFTFFSDFKNVTFYAFWNDVSRSRKKVVSKSLVHNPSKWVHILRSVVTVIQFPAIYQGVSEKDHHGLSLIFPNNWFLKLKIWLGYEAIIITQQAGLWHWWLRPVLTFGNCVLKTGVIKWPLKLHV